MLRSQLPTSTENEDQKTNSQVKNSNMESSIETKSSHLFINDYEIDYEYTDDFNSNLESPVAVNLSANFTDVTEFETTTATATTEKTSDVFINPEGEHPPIQLI